MSTIANLIIVGRVGQISDIKQTVEGKPFLSLSLAVDGKGKNESTTWFRVTFWDKKAMIIKQHLSPGALVYVEARPYESESSGVKYWNFSGTTITFLSSSTHSDLKKRDDDILF